jgi:hypothetical protein
LLEKELFENLSMKEMLSVGTLMPWVKDVCSMKPLCLSFLAIPNTVEPYQHKYSKITTVQ